MLTQDQVVIDGIGNITQDVIDELRSGEKMQHVLAETQATAIAQEESQQQRHHMEWGKVHMRIPEDAFHYWGMRLGYECWNDKQFLREFWRDNERVRIKNAPNKTRLNLGSILPKGTILDQGNRILAQ